MQRVGTSSHLRATIDLDLQTPSCPSQIVLPIRTKQLAVKFGHSTSLLDPASSTSIIITSEGKVLDSILELLVK
jgi:hypothetical protein